jgi:hypothetical protein
MATGVGFMADMVRKHFILPKDLAREFEEIVGERNQSAEVARLIENWLRNRRFIEIVDRHAGFVRAEDHPEWSTAKDVEEWHRELRAEDEAPKRVALQFREERGPDSD